MRRRVTLAGVVCAMALASSALATGSSATSTGAYGAHGWDGHLRSEWKLVTSHGEFAPLAPAPEHSVIYLHAREDGSRFSIKRLGPDLDSSWTTRWRRHDATLARVTPSAVAAGGRSGMVVVAAEGVCASRVARKRAAGPILLRGYSLDSGHRAWSTSIGHCPVGPSHRRGQVLRVSGLDVWGQHTVMSFTAGISIDKHPRTRTGHVTSLSATRGHTRWSIALPHTARATDVVTTDVAVNRRIVAVVGSTDTPTTPEQALAIGLSPGHGAQRWSLHRGGALRDWYDSIDSTRAHLYLTGTFGDAPEGGGGHGVLTRLTASGSQLWRAHVPPMATVSALAHGGPVWGSVAWNRRGHPFVFGRQHPGGRPGWRQEWRIVSFPSATEFAATQSRLYAGAEVIDARAHASLHTWCWSWR